MKPGSPGLLAAAGLALLAALSMGLGVAWRADGWFRVAEAGWGIALLVAMTDQRAWLGRMAAGLRRVDWRRFGTVLALGLCLGFYRLTRVPAAVHGDEGMVGLFARRLFYGEAPTFFSSGWYHLPQFFFRCLPWASP